MVSKLIKNFLHFMILPMCSCTFNFELTSQRTALENQVLGSYKEIEDELILLSPVRNQLTPGEPTKTLSEAARSKMNQDFNRDDIEELKAKGILGETIDGALALSQPPSKGQPETSKLAAELIREENADRLKIWSQIISSNPNLSIRDLPNVRLTYAKMIREKSPPGHYFMNENRKWDKK